jgi:anti-sigma B factor antagonist
MPIREETRNGVCHLAVEGEMTIYTATELKSELAPHLSQAQIEIDLSQVSEMDSAGLQLLILAKREATRGERILHLTGHSQAVLEVMDICNMAAYFGDPVIISSHA